MVKNAQPLVTKVGSIRWIDAPVSRREEWQAQRGRERERERKINKTEGDR